MLENLHHLASSYNRRLDRLASITLGEIWSSVNYHPFPRPINVLAITLAVLYVGKIWGGKLYTYRRAREILTFSWPAPEV